MPYRTQIQNKCLHSLNRGHKILGVCYPQHKIGGGGSGADRGRVRGWIGAGLIITRSVNIRAFIITNPIMIESVNIKPDRGRGTGGRPPPIGGQYHTPPLKKLDAFLTYGTLFATWLKYRLRRI